MNKKLAIFFTINILYSCLTISTPALSESINTNQSEINNLIDSKKVSIIFLPTYGNQNEVNIKGRVTRYIETSLPNANDSPTKNFNRNIEYFKNEAIKDLNLNIKFNHKTVKAVTDDRGIFELKIQDFGNINLGFNQVSAEVSDNNYSLANPSLGQITIQNKEAQDYAVISDIDDTIQESHITNRFEAIQTLFFGNYKTQEKIAGTSELYQILDKNNDGIVNGDIHYVSGSPIEILDRLQSFMNYHNFPQGSIDLKRIGLGKNDDNPTQQRHYKLGKIRNLFNTYPNKKFILFGDSGERDPEIYKKIAEEYPERVIGIYINNVTAEKRYSKRFKDIILTKNTSEAARDLYRHRIISRDDYDNIKSLFEINKL